MQQEKITYLNDCLKLKNTIKHLSFLMPIKTMRVIKKRFYQKHNKRLQKNKFFLFPNNQDDGDLETLLLEIAKHDEFLKCFEGYLECIKSKEHYKPIKNISKSKWYAYLEVFELQNFFKDKRNKNDKKNEEKIIIDDKGKIRKEYKEEYEKLKEVIDFNSNSLIPLKDFLGQFAK